MNDIEAVLPSHFNAPNLDNILDSRQSGFCKNYSILTPLINIVDNFRKAVDVEKDALLVGTDFRYAFDLMTASLLIDKIKTLIFYCF